MKNYSRAVPGTGCLLYTSQTVMSIPFITGFMLRDITQANGKSVIRTVICLSLIHIFEMEAQGTEEDIDKVVQTLQDSRYIVINDMYVADRRCV